MRYLYFGDSNNSLTIPSDRLLSMDQTADDKLFLRFEGQDGTASDTTVELTINSNTEKVVANAISDAVLDGRRGSLVVVADDVDSVYLTSDIKSVVINAGGTVDAGLTAGTGVTTATGGAYHSWIEEKDSIIKTSIFVDLTGLHSTADGDVIGVDGAANSHIGQYTTAKSGTLFAGRISYMEIPAGGDPDIELHAADEATLAEDAAITTGTNNAALATPAVDVVVSQMGPFALSALPGADQYLYLVAGETTDGDYTAGKVLIELYGTK